VPLAELTQPPCPQRAAQRRRSNPAATAEASAQPAANSAQRLAAATRAGFDPAAQKAEADYTSRWSAAISAAIRFSPPQSKKAGLSGDVKVRFVVDRKGGISGVSVAGSSGHACWTGEALQFIQRLSPVPAFPARSEKGGHPADHHAQIRS
jgi:protein TonB